MASERPTALALRRALKRSITPDAVDEDGWTDLHYAAALDLDGIAYALLARGAAVEARLKEDRQHVGRAGEILRGFGCSFTSWSCEGDAPLHIAAWANARDTAAVLLDHGADVDVALCLKTRPLHLAAWYDGLETAALLLDRGADLQAQDWAEWSPLHHAAWRSSLRTAAFLLERGADVDAKAADDWTSLHVTALDDACDAARLLLDRGADVNALAREFQITPLDMAETLNARETARVLRAHGGDTTTEDAYEFAGIAVARLNASWGVGRAFFRKALKRRAPRNRRKASTSD